MSISVKKRMQILFLCLSIILFFAPSAFGGGGYGWSLWGSVTCEALWKGIPSMSNFDGLVKYEITIRQVLVNCDNPAGNSPDSLSWVHLDQEATVSSETLSSDWIPVKGGKVLTECTIIPDSDILAAGDLFPGEVCPNDGWLLELISITDFDYTITFVIDGEDDQVYYGKFCTFGDNPQPGDIADCDETGFISY